MDSQKLVSYAFSKRDFFDWENIKQNSKLD